MMRYDPSKRPSASECLQHPYFQVRLPIPLSAVNDEEESKTKPGEETKREEFVPPNPMSRAEAGENAAPTRPAAGRVKVTSKELMQNARYKPGVKSGTLKGKA